MGIQSLCCRGVRLRRHGLSHVFRNSACVSVGTLCRCGFRGFPVLCCFTGNFAGNYDPNGCKAGLAAFFRLVRGVFAKPWNIEIEEASREICSRDREASRRKGRASHSDAEARLPVFPIEWDVCADEGFEGDMVRQRAVENCALQRWRQRCERDQAARIAV